MDIRGDIVGIRITILKPELISSNKGNTEYRQVTEDVDNDRGQQAFFNFVGQGKNESTNELCDGNAAVGWMADDKQQGAANKGRPQAPLSKKPKKDSPKINLFGNGSDKRTDEHEQCDILWRGRHRHLDHAQGVDSREV